MRIPALEDSKLPLLAQAANPEAMLGAFKRYFRRRYPEWADRISACLIGQIRYKPGKYCRFIYQLRLRGEQGEFDQWFVGKMYPEGRIPRPDELCIDDGASGNGHWMPVDYWPEMGLVLSAFPFDRKLPHLSKLVDLAEVGQLAQNHPEAFGLTPDWHCKRVTVHQVNYKPRKRCVLRYDFDWRGPAGELRHPSVYSKTYSTRKSDYIYTALRSTWEGLSRRKSALLVPRPMCYFKSLNTIWQEAWNGTPLSEMIIKGDWDTHLPRIAESLAALHLGDFDCFELRPAPSLAKILENVHGDEADIAVFFGGTRPEIRGVVAELEAQQTRLNSVQVPSTPIHGTFKLSQILVGETGVAVVDFDGVAVGDPLYDVAEFIASILVLRAKHGLSTERVASGIGPFLRTYADQVLWACDLARIRWYTTAFLLAHIHSLLKRLKIQNEEQFMMSLEIIRSDLPAALEKLM